MLYCASRKEGIMPFAVDVGVVVRDAHERESENVYRLDTELADDGGNMSAILSKVDAINTAYEGMTMSSVVRQNITIVRERSFSAPNEAADNSLYAFVALKDSGTQENDSVRIPAPDMFLLFDAAENGLLDPAFQVAFGLLNSEIVNPETGNDYDFEFAQLLTRKKKRLR